MRKVSKERLKKIFTERIVPTTTDKVIDMCISGLCTDGEHHKQYYFEKILTALGVDMTMLKEIAEAQDYGWEPGIAP